MRRLGPLLWLALACAVTSSVAEGEQPMKDEVRVALMATVPVRWDVQHNFDVFLTLLAEADERGAEVFLTPEGWLDGYASHADDSTPDRLRGVAQSVGESDYLAAVAAEAKRRKMWIGFGFVQEREGKIYNACGLWNADGTLVGVYHKTHLQGRDLQFSPGEALPVFDSPWGPLGIMICADRRWPEVPRCLRLQGARLILNPTYGMHHDKNLMWMRTRGYENQCFITFAHPEQSFIIDPNGDVAAYRTGDGVLVETLDLGRCKWNNHLADRRPDLYGVICEPKGE